MMNQLTKYLKENPNASPKAICYKLAQREFLQLLVKKDFITNGEILQGDALLEVLGKVSPLVNVDKLRHCVYT
jgi:hypothetical protein